jgi:hypothetical protein
MAISDTLIELLTFSKQELEALAKDRELSVPRGGDKFDVAQALAQQITLRELREAAGEHLGAGRTSLSWVALLQESENVEGAEEPIAEDTPLTAQPLSLQEVETALRELTGKRRPFDANLRPDEVTTEPVLVNAQYDGGDLVFFTLAVERTRRLVIRNFNFRRTPEDQFFHVLLRLSRGVLEVRAESRLASRVTKGWISTFGEALGREPLRLHLSQRDIDELREALDARMDRHDARHEDEEAGYGRQTVTASTRYPDLPASPRFQRDFEGSDPVASDLLFDFNDASGTTKEVRIRISPRAGTIRCVNHVSNEVMQHVYDTLREIRAARVTESQDDQTPTS